MSKEVLVDIYTIAWKEWKEIFCLGNNWEKTFVYLLLCLIALAIVMPLPAKNTQEFIDDSFDLMYYWSTIPYFLLYFYRQFGVFEERQRKTLLTLMATATPNYAIVLGKISATVTFCWGSTVLTSILSLAKANLSARQNTPLFYTWQTFFFGSAVSLLFTILVASCGMLISFYNETPLQFHTQYFIVSFSLL